VTNGVPTTYTLDPSASSGQALNAGLVQVLAQQDASGVTTYLYGVARIGEEQPTGWAYHLSDALGSVRQLADGSAQVTLARGYMPYGEELWSLGAGGSEYGYTGEDWNTVTQLVFLRARYMQPGLGMFLSRDPWNGDMERPGSMNGWSYSENNPTNYTDPAGLWRWWATPSLYHEMVENYYEGTWGFFNPFKQLEYPIPGTPFRHADMFNSALGDVYEVEPWFNRAAGANQVANYVTDLQRAAAPPNSLLQGKYWLTGAPYNWNNAPFHIGTGMDWPGKLRTFMPPFIYLDLVADYAGNGVVIYWFEPNALAAVPFLRVPNKKLVRQRNWVPGQPSLQPQVLSWDEACATAVIVVGGAMLTFTVVEDIATGGLGVPDDIVTVPAGIFLIYLGSRQAGFVRVQESGPLD
jgi:RHS repeat-associated protein